MDIQVLLEDAQETLATLQAALDVMPDEKQFIQRLQYYKMREIKTLQDMQEHMSRIPFACHVEVDFTCANCKNTVTTYEPDGSDTGTHFVDCKYCSARYVANWHQGCVTEIRQLTE